MSAPRWRVAAASVPGTSHAKIGTPCQDAHGCTILTNGWLVAAVADGAGSAPQSEVGAKLAVRIATQAVAAALLAKDPNALTDAERGDHAWRVLLEEAFRAAREAIEAEAALRAVPARDLATTLTVACATGDMAVAAQIGDGAAIVADTAGALHALARPIGGEYLNETTFLVSPGALENIQFATWHGAIAHVALLSDGLQMLALHRPDGGPHAPFFAPLFQFVAGASDPIQASATLAGFLQSPRVTARADDDLTLVLAVALPPVGR
jgi:hypothetical protein